MAGAILTGATAGVDGRVLAFAEQVVARAGYRTALVTSGYRPGAVTTHGTPSLHSKGEAVDIAATGTKLTRLGQAALELAGVTNARSIPSWSAQYAGGWEIIFNSNEGGNHFNHLHLGWEGARNVSSGAPVPAGVPRINPGGRYSFTDLMQLWVNAGGARQHAAMAAQVALLESGGSPAAHAKTIREDSRGLWQINVKAHPNYKSANLYDPAVNVRAAIAISSNGSNWQPWSTATAARAALAARGVVNPPSVTRPGGSSGGGGSIFDSVGGALGGVGGVLGSGAGAVWNELRGVTEWGAGLIKLIGFVVDPKNWLRLVEFLFGFSLLMLGLAMLIVEFSKRDTATGAAARGVTRAASRFTPTGRLASYYKESRRRTGGPARRERISTAPVPVYRTSSSSRSGPSDSIPF